jgi:hypothetical protein
LSLGVSNAGKAMITNGSGFITSSGTTSTELGYVSGVTSAIQTQLNAKQGTIDKTTTQAVSKLRVYGANTANYVELSAPTLGSNLALTFPNGNGSSGNVLSTDGSGNLSWTAITNPVTSVNSLTGAIVLTTDTVGEGSTNLYYTNARTLASTITSPTLTNSAIATGDTIQVVVGKLQAQVSSKEGTLASGTTAQYYRGDKSWQTLDTSVIPENSNLYYTNARGIGSTITAPTLSNSVIATGDTLQVVVGKLQAQLNNLLSTALTGLSTATSSVITATDTILSGLGKLQAQITTHTTSLASKADTTNVSQTITASMVTGLTTPVANSDAANKAYVDSSQTWTVASGNAYRSTGSVGIGNSAPNSKLEVTGAITTTANVISSGAAVDLSLSNVHVLNSVGGSAITLSNMTNGASYTIIVRDNTVRTYTFSGCTTKFSPANAATDASSETIYGITTIQISSTWYCYVTWTSGFQ